MPFLDKIREALGSGGIETLMTAGRIAGTLDPSFKAFHGINSLVGAGQGFVRGGKPRISGGKLYFEGLGENSPPQASGDVMLLPKTLEDASPVELAHERRHQEQSSSLGPLYSAIAGIGDLATRGRGAYLNPLEVDAYTSQPEGAETQTDMKTIANMAESPLERFLLDISMRKR